MMSSKHRTEADEEQFEPPIASGSPADTTSRAACECAVPPPARAGPTTRPEARGCQRQRRPSSGGAPRRGGEARNPARSDCNSKTDRRPRHPRSADRYAERRAASGWPQRGGFRARAARRRRAVPGGVAIVIEGRLNQLPGDRAYPNRVRGVWGKAVAEEGLEPPTPGL